MCQSNCWWMFCRRGYYQTSFQNSFGDSNIESVMVLSILFSWNECLNRLKHCNCFSFRYRLRFVDYHNFFWKALPCDYFFLILIFFSNCLNSNVTDESYVYKNKIWCIKLLTWFLLSVYMLRTLVEKGI